MAINKFGKGGFDSADSSFQGIGTLVTHSSFTLGGCMDATAFNYNPSATFDDGSCIAKVFGCTDPLASNYDAAANTDDGSCAYIGCNDPNAFNYVANSTSTTYPPCIAKVFGCTDGQYGIAETYTGYDNSGVVIGDFTSNDPSNTNLYLSQPTNVDYRKNTNFNQNANVNEVSATDNSDPCIPRIFGCMNPLAANYNLNANTERQYECQVIPAGTLGCTDSTACNYEPSATVDDGSCGFCDDFQAVNYDPLLIQNSTPCPGTGTGPAYYLCKYCHVVTNLSATTTTTSINVSWLPQTLQQATIEKFEIRYKIQGSGSSGWSSIDLSATTTSYSITGLDPSTTYRIQVRTYCLDDNGNPGFNSGLHNQAQIQIDTDSPVIAGCMQGSLTFPQVYSNYNPLATTNIDPLTLNMIPCLNCLYGCTDIDSQNFDNSATCDNGSCIPHIQGCTDPNSDNNKFSSTATQDDGSCEYNGCTDPTATNFSFIGSTVNGPLGLFTYNAPFGNTGIAVDDGSCIPTVLGCTDPTAFNYDSNANTDDSSCIPCNSGCMDLNGPNYDASHNCDCAGTPNGSATGCCGFVGGCMDPEADNYDSNATAHNNSCIYSGCSDPYSTNYGFIDSINATTITGYTNPGQVNTEPGHESIPQNSQYVHEDLITDLNNGTVTVSGTSPYGTVTNNGSCIIPAAVGCGNAFAVNTSPFMNQPQSQQQLLANCCWDEANYTNLVTSNLAAPYTGSFQSHGSDGVLASGIACYAGCPSTSSAGNAGLTAGPASQLPTIPVFVDPSPYAFDPATEGGCLNFTQSPVVDDTIEANMHGGSAAASLAGAVGGYLPNGNTPGAHPFSIGIKCDETAGTCPDLSVLATDVFITQNYLGTSPGLVSFATKITATLENHTTGRRYTKHHVQNEFFSYIIGNADNVLSQHSFWEDHSSPNSTNHRKRVGVDGYHKRGSSGGAFGSGGFIDDPGFLLNATQGINADTNNKDLEDLITDVVDVANTAPFTNHHLASQTTPAIEHDARIVFRTHYGAILAVHDFEIKVGCLDYDYDNYCPTCNAQPRNFTSPHPSGIFMPTFDNDGNITAGTGNYTLCHNS
jgi:hypothetical protein